MVIYLLLIIRSNEEDPIVISESEGHLPPTTSSDGGHTSVPDSIPIPHSRPPASPTSRDAPITIPDSPPLTPPTSSQPSIPMATTAPSSTTSNIPLVNPLSVVQASVNSLPVVTAQPLTTVVSLDKMLEINQSLINATAQLCAQTTLALTGRTSLPSSSQLPAPQPPSLKSIPNQTLYLSTVSTSTTTNSQTHAGQPVPGAQINNSSSDAKITSDAQSTSSVAEEGKSVAAATVVSTTTQSVSVARAVATSVQASSTSAMCTVQSSATVSSLQLQSASSSTAVVQASRGQIRSISTATTSTNVLAQGGSISAPQSLPPPSATTTAAASNASTMIIRSSTSHMAPSQAQAQAGVLQPTTSLTNPKVQGSGTLVCSAVSGAGLDQSKRGVATTLSSANTQSSGATVTNSISKQSKAVSTCVLPLATQIATSAICTPTHTFRDPVSVTSSFDQPYTPLANFPYSFSAPVIISQLGRRGVAPPAAAQPMAPHSVRPAMSHVVEARVVQSTPPPEPPRGPGVLMGRGVFGHPGHVTSTLPGHVTSIGVSVGGYLGVPTGVGQAVPSIVAQVAPPRFGVPPPPPPSQGTTRIPPGIPPGLAKPPPPLQARVAPPSTFPPSSRPPQLVTQGLQVGTAQVVSQGVQISAPHVVSQNVPAPTIINDSMKIKSSEPVMISQYAKQGNLLTHSEALGQKTSMVASLQEGQKKMTAASGEKKAKEPEIRRRGRPRKVNRQEEGRERGGNGGATEAKGGRGRPRKQSHDLIIEEYAPSNQGGEGKEEERRRSSRKRKLKSPDGTTSIATASTNEITGSDVQGRHMMDVATQSVRLASDKASTEVRASNPPSSSLANPVPTKTTSNKGADNASSHSIAAGTTSGSAGKVANEKGERSTAEGDASDEKVVEPESAKNEQGTETEQNVPPMDGNMDSQVEGGKTSINTVPEDSEDPLCGLKSKRRREREGEGGEEEGETEKQSRTEQPEPDGGDEGKGQAASPELITSETEVDQGETMMDSETHDSSDTSESKKDESSSDSTGTKHAQISDSKPLTASSETQSAEQSKVTTFDSATKDSDKTTSSSHESNGGRKCLSLRRHSTGPSAASSGDSLNGEGGERGEVGEGRGAGGEREETAAGGSRKSLVDTPTNGKGGILKHTSQFDTPSTAKVSRVDSM